MLFMYFARVLAINKRDASSEWANSKTGVTVIPAQPISVALYLTHLVNRATSQNESVGGVETAAYIIRWGHRMAGLPSPTDHSIQ